MDSQYKRTSFKEKKSGNPPKESKHRSLARKLLPSIHNRNESTAAQDRRANKTAATLVMSNPFFWFLDDALSRTEQLSV